MPKVFSVFVCFVCLFVCLFFFFWFFLEERTKKVSCFVLFCSFPKVNILNVHYSDWVTVS